MIDAPLHYLSASGDRAETILPLTWTVLSISLAVVAIIAVLLLLSLRRRVRHTDVAGEPVTRGGHGVQLILRGVLISLVPLLFSLVWTVAALGHLAPPTRRSSVEVEITAHQWWWSITYDSDMPGQIFTTANELHIPVDVPVRLRLASADVIHSFWVPQLAGKTDVIPGQVNQAWIEAEVPGVFRGQCQEYCGLQHAHMGLEVIAEPLADFEAWRRAQLQTAPPPMTPTQLRGRYVFESRCALCHSVRGTIAHSNIGPDLSHLAGRRTLAAATLLNNRGNLAGWIENPQATKPGSLMPNQHLSGHELTDVVAYLETLE